MILAHKIALDPNDVQETYFRKAAGIRPLHLQLVPRSLAAAI